MRFCWHDWPKWADLEVDGKEGRVSQVNPQPGGLCTGYYKLQSRRCTKCNRLQLRTAKS